MSSSSSGDVSISPISGPKGDCAVLREAGYLALPIPSTRGLDESSSNKGTEGIVPVE